MNISAFPQLKRNAIRFEQILRVLAKYGLAEWLKESGPEFVQRILTSSEGEKLGGLARSQRIRMALAELGTTFIKLGQMLSTRPDLVGDELAHELRRLQDDTPADDFESVRATIEHELGQPLEELFASIEEEPLASASIAQVHGATLEGGAEVVVKVQHSGIEAKVVNDLDILVSMAGLAEKYN
ncbi:MAG: AarF/ABC1/UbiB kinase family protein, partial [Akkermansiaceae bacterium]|nr:AarF/ABC1/UbiB kinase family protein [Akkermansiaceae bacterium]